MAGYNNSILFGFIIPVIYHLWVLKSGENSDYDITNRKERHKPYIVMILSSFLSLFIILSLVNAPRFLVVIIIASATQITIMFVINLYWKISGHTAAIASFSGMLCILG